MVNLNTKLAVAFILALAAIVPVASVPLPQ